MYPIAHVIFTLLITKRFWQKENLSLHILALGALLPDLMDKSLLLLFNTGNGRFIAHTLAFALIGYMVTSLISRKTALSLSTGIIFHLLEDLNSPVPWFYPLIEYDFIPRGEYNFFEAYFSFFGIGTDAIAIILALGIFRREFQGITLTSKTTW